MQAIFWCLVFLFASVQSRSHERPNPFGGQIGLECREEGKLSDDALLDILDEHNIIVRKNPHVYSFFECTFRKYKFLEDGKFVKDTIIPYMVKGPVEFYKPDVVDHQKTAEETYELCKNEEGKTAGERVVNFMNCAVGHLSIKK
uniref:Uncharacterized protein n=1 Tax=Photinus pyralis TaxID=7054 RepID=A0A1Y1KHQ1_PHOPY